MNRNTYKTSAHIITFWATELTDAMRDAADWIDEHAAERAERDGEHPGYGDYFVHAPAKVFVRGGVPVFGDKFGFAYNVSVTY